MSVNGASRGQSPVTGNSVAVIKRFGENWGLTPGDSRQNIDGCLSDLSRHGICSIKLVDFRVTPLDGVLFNFENTVVIVQLYAGKTIQVQRVAHHVIA